MSTSQASLSAASDDRKARLAKLKNLKRKQPTDEVVPPESTRSPSPPAGSVSISLDASAADHDTRDTAMGGSDDRPHQHLHVSGRNYDPEVRGAKLGFEAPPTQGMKGPTLEEQAAAVEVQIRDRAAQEARDADKGIDLFKLQPKKPNWDLKRDLDRKLEVLNVRTDNAIARLVRDRITAAQKAKGQQQISTSSSNAEGDEGAVAGMDGVALVEGLRVREREDEEEMRREREEEHEEV